MSRKVSIKKKSFPKTDVRYWDGKVGFPTSANRTYSVQFSTPTGVRGSILGRPTRRRRRSWLANSISSFAPTAGRKPFGAVAETRQSRKRT